MSQALHALLDAATRATPAKVAVRDPGGPEITYAELATLSDRLRDRLVALGVQAGDRVGIHIRKSVDSIATLFGILKTGGAYVPVDPDAPLARCAYIFNDCGVKAVVVERRLADTLRAELAALGDVPPLLILDDDTSAVRLGRLLDDEDAKGKAPSAATVSPPADALAYMLYTSGSTGKPKGVTISHRAARAFVDWCSAEFEPRADDIFSSHAPLHFDLSIHDIYVSLKHGATLVLISEELGKDPAKLAQAIADQKISVWYSTPSILSLLAQYGKLEKYDHSSVRIVHFAGEVFPMPQFHAIRAKWPQPRYFNLYGPTETNVCTWYAVPQELDPNRVDPFPIGELCAHYRGRVVDEEGHVVPFGAEGELICAGPGVMSGYHNLPAQNASAFLTDAQGERWYRTGDLVVEEQGTGYLFHGRRDRMVKRRGYRVELGEIEAGLATHPDILEIAVIAIQEDGGGVKIRAFLSAREGAVKPSIIALKQFSSQRLPKYMIPDTFVVLDALPRTSTDKIDYQTLKSRA